MLDSQVGQGNVEGWYMVFISSTACIFGAAIVFIDKVWHRRQGSILSSRAFLASAMALASGVLLISSLAILLPESQIRLKSTPKAYGWFLFGAFLTLCLTRLIHWCAPDALHACGSDSPKKHHHNHHSHHNHHHHHHHHHHNNGSISPTASSFSSPTMIQHEHSLPSTDLRIQQLPMDDEQRKLIASPDRTTTGMDYGSTVLVPNSPFSLQEHTQYSSSRDLERDNHKLDHHGIDIDTDDMHHNSISSISSSSSSNSEDDPDDHMDLENNKEYFWSIGIQTAIAICVHKFPEGLVMFISSQASSSLGLSVAAAMSIHNLTEGVMMALPIYYATGSSTNAFLYASFMGGLSQPLGALIGLLAFRSTTKYQEDVLFGITFGIISGMMCFITIQGMLPQAIQANHHHHVVLFFFLGVLLVGLTSLLKTI
ncbi:Zinc/iron permease [Absidia repens]|uniref:Zinc/iron permease n=1 Tax=Absidia repens TaxID=90262 RepID=A0A1X2IH67_9FUNG|nr:Zinc/iron permease [Absidia repens]